MPLNMIVALSDDNAIGHAGTLIWHLSADLRHFKALTTGHAVIMGRRTWESLPCGALPHRHNIVVSSHAGFHAPGAIVAGSLDRALQQAYSLDPEPFIIGGATLYAATMGMAEKLYLTRVHALYPEADTRFPMIEPSCWQVVDTSQEQTDPKSGLTFTFETLVRKA